MRTTVRRHLGKVVAGTAIAVAATAAMIAVTLPGTAGAEGNGGTAGGRPAAAGQPGATGAQGAGQDGAAGTVASGVVEAAPAEGEKGKGRDPLTDDEMARVERIARAGRLSDSARNVEGGRGPQTVAVDLAEPDADEVDDASAPRRAEVSFYDYRDDTLVTRTVDLDTGKVEDTASGQGVQPPLSRAEDTEATALLIADRLGAGLREDYRDATGKKLTSPDQLKVSSMIYRASPGAQPAAFDACGTHRCARLLIKVVNGPWIDTRSLVVDLSAGKVARLTG